MSNIQRALERQFGRPSTRRGILIGVPAAALVAVVLRYSNPQARAGVAEVASGLRAAMARPEPGVTLPDRREVSDATLESVYQKHFSGREHLMSKEAWIGGGSNNIFDFYGFGKNIAPLANLYYAHEKGAHESFDAFYARFVDGLAAAARVANLDFVSFAASLEVSGENIPDLKSQKTDIFISRIQTLGVPLARHLGGLDLRIVRELRPDGLYHRLKDSQFKGLVPEQPGEGLDLNAIVRFRSEATTGMMDWEASQRARAVLVHGSDELKDTMKREFPEVVRRYEEILAQQGVDFKPLIGTPQALRREGNLASARNKLKTVADDFMANHGGILDIFALYENDLRAIGIGLPVDEWQLANRTDIWYRLILHADKADGKGSDEKAALDDVKRMMGYDFKNRRDRFYKKLLSQQILNPKFIPFLLNKARVMKNTDMEKRLVAMQHAVDSYQLQASEVRKSYLEAAAAEGPHEYNSRFQQLSTAATTKMLSDIAGPYDPNKPDDLYWHIYRMVANREIGHPFLMVQETTFAPDITIDPPYTPSQTLRYLDEFQQRLIDLKMIDKPFYQNIQPLFWVFNNVNIGNFADYPWVTEAQRHELTEFFRFHVAEEPHVAIWRAQLVLANLLH